ncbi:MAG: histidine phosphatase family protein [Lachnospiraceae bacterium]|nr:histidine phosphatase family protein [Lachnospiraceae bacterium]
MLYIMRHGSTDWNEEHKLQGRTDIPLNARGRKMAEDAASRFRDVNIDICYCSPLKRAEETARIFLEGRNVPIITDERLAEMGFGICEGEKYMIPGTDGPIKALFEEPDEYKVPVPGGESFKELFDRTGSFLDEIAVPLSDSGKDVLIVGHGAMNTSIICRMRNIPLKDFWGVGIEQCTLTRLK